MISCKKFVTDHGMA